MARGLKDNLGRELKTQWHRKHVTYGAVIMIDMSSKRGTERRHAFARQQRLQASGTGFDEYKGQQRHENSNQDREREVKTHPAGRGQGVALRRITTPPKTCRRWRRRIGARWRRA